MAPKRPSPLDEPPSASSSSEEEAETSSEVGSSSEDEEDQPLKPPQPQPISTEKKPASNKKPPPPAAPIPKSQPKPSVSESETESDSDDETERPTENTDLIVKPIASKPKEETPKAKKSKSQPSVSPAKSTAKRPSDNNRPVTDSKKAKKAKDAAGTDGITVPEDDGKKAGDESKKLFQRIWSEDDEIAILTGLVEYADKTGEPPLKDMNGFHDFIKKSVHADVSKEQLANKIRTLKRKYVTNIGRGKNGEAPRFSKPYDKRVFELSKKIWVDEVANGGTEKSNGKKKKKVKEASSVGASQKPEADLGSGLTEARKVDINVKAGSLPSLSEMIRFNRSLGLSGLDDDAIRRGYELIGASKKAELEDRWKKLQIAELELFVKRAELVKDQASLILEATKSSGN